MLPLKYLLLPGEVPGSSRYESVPLAAGKMIVVCPSCATHQDVPQGHLADGRTLIRCGVCGQGWIESRAIDVIEAAEFEPILPAVVAEEDSSISADFEVMRLAEAARLAKERFAEKERLKRRELRGWAILALTVIVPLSLAIALPNRVAEAFPPAARLYVLAGLDINVRGLEFRNVGQKYTLSNGTRVLAIQGEIVNTDDRDRRVPTLKFALKDEQGKSVYDWDLNSTTRPIRPGEVSAFVTRVASPPESASQIEIRFTGPGDSSTNAQP